MRVGVSVRREARTQTSSNFSFSSAMISLMSLVSSDIRFAFSA